MADILHDSGLVKDDVIKKELGVDGIQFNKIDFGNPSDNPALEEWELGRLANHIHHEKLVTLAKQHFYEQLTDAQIANIRSNNVGDAWSASFEILVQWRNKPGNNRQVSNAGAKCPLAHPPPGMCISPPLPYMVVSCKF